MRAINASHGLWQRPQILTMTLLCGALLFAAPRETSGFWIICDLIDAFGGADRAAEANEKMLERTAAGDAAGADQAKQEMKKGIQDAAKSAQELLEKTPGTTVNPTPPGVEDLINGVWEGLKDLFNSVIGANRSQLTVPPPVPDGAFAAQGPIYTASLAGQHVDVTPPQSITVNLSMVAPSDYDGSRGPAPPGFFDLPPAIYGIGTFSDAMLRPFQVFDPDGASHFYDAAQLAADLAADPDLASTALPGSNFTSNIFSLVPESNPDGVQVMYLNVTSVDPSTGSISGMFWTGTVVPEPGDIDADLDVDRGDLALFAQHLGADSGSRWIDGDFDGDGATTLLDLGLLQMHLGPSIALSPAAAAVPEPATWIGVVVGALGLWLTFRRRRQFS